MLTVALYLVLAMAAGGVLFFLSVAIFGGGAPETQRAALEPLPARSDLVSVTADTVPLALPDDRAMSATDIDALRLPVALRGYRMAETDKALDRLARELTERDEQIEALRAELARQELDPADLDLDADADTDAEPLPVPPTGHPADPPAGAVDAHTAGREAQA